MTRLIDTLKSFYGLAAGIGVIMPGFSFFSNFSPPLFKGIAIIVSALAVAVIVIIANKAELKKNLNLITKKYTSLAIRLLSISFLLLLAYLFMLDFTTLVPDDFPEERWQVGFDLQPASLTPLARELMKDNDCNENKETLLSCAGIQKANVLLLYTRASIYGAGLLLIFLFTIAALTWSAGWTYLAKSYLIKNKNH